MASPWTYGDLDRFQRQIAARARSGGPGALILSELAPVITLGRRARPEEELRLPPGQLSRLGIGIQATDRGGLATYHGPGQWVLFVVDSLERLTGDRRGVRSAVEGLLRIALRVGGEYTSGLELRGGCEMGVWSPRGKVACVGIHIEQGILLHGISVNGFATSTSFVGLRPCGIEGGAPDYLLRGATASEAEEFLQLGSRILEEASRVFSRKGLSQDQVGTT